MAGRSLGAIAFAAITLTGCGGGEQRGSGEGGSSAANEPLLRVTRLYGTLVRMGSLGGEPLYGIRLRADVCARSAAQADQTYPTSYSMAHHVTPGRTATRWPKAFRGVFDELHWLVPLGETTSGACRRGVEFDDVIPPDDYGGVESPLGCLGYCRAARCYGAQLTLRAVGVADRRRTRMAASRRAIIQCGRFGPE